MFVQDFEVIAVSYDEVSTKLASGLDAVLLEAFESARAEGERLLVRVGPSHWPALLAKTVEIRPTVVRSHGDGKIFGFTWKAEGGTWMFPKLDADLEVAPFGMGQTQLVLRGRYEPVGGMMGHRGDELLLHRIAESTIRAFLTSICATLLGWESERASMTEAPAP